MAAVVINSLLTAAIFWMSFCRLEKMDETIDVLVRFSVWLNGATSVYLFCSPFYWNFLPPWQMLLGLCALALTTASTTRFWIYGIPWFYRKENIK